MTYFYSQSMKLNLRSLVYSGDYDAVPVAIAGFFIIQALCAYGGIGVSPDSVVYISTAQNIHDHGVINDFTNMPVMDFPAFSFSPVTPSRHLGRVSTACSSPWSSVSAAGC
jgi:hypothetical protein